MDHKTKKVWAVEMSCPCIEHWEMKSKEKTAKYRPLQFDLKKQYPGYDIEQSNIIIVALGAWSRDLNLTMRKLFGTKGFDVSRRMQNATVSSSLNIVRTLSPSLEFP